MRAAPELLQMCGQEETWACAAGVAEGEASCGAVWLATLGWKVVVLLTNRMCIGSDGELSAVPGRVSSTRVLPFSGLWTCRTQGRGMGLLVFYFSLVWGFACVHVVRVWRMCLSQEWDATDLTCVRGDSPQLFSASLLSADAKASQNSKKVCTKGDQTNPTRGSVENKENEGKS